MFYKIKVRTHVRVSPDKFSEDIKKAVLDTLNKQFEGYISKDLGAVIAVSEITDIGEGVIISGDGAAYYDTEFKIFTFKPELQEVVLGKINDITDFGAFMDIGPLDGMIHVSQTMDDFVSFSKGNVLTGKESKKNLRVGDKCRARIIAISYKDQTSPKIGLTMRQLKLGSLSWIEQDLKKQDLKKVKREVKKK